MTTVNRQYPLPNRDHAVVDDVEAMRVAFGMVGVDVENSELEIAELSERVTNLRERALHFSGSAERSELQNIIPGGYIKVGVDGNSFECVGGGGDPGGIFGQCSVKRSEGNFDTSWGNFYDISKNGMTVRENLNFSSSNETHIFVNEVEVENEKQLPRVELTDHQVIGDVFAENNESFLLTDAIEQREEETLFATDLNYGLIKVGTGINVEDGVISVPNAPVASNAEFGLGKIGSGLSVANGIITVASVLPATNSLFGTVKLGWDFSINANGEMELADMADASIIYKLSQMKAVQNGIVDLEEKALIYRAVVTEDLQFSFNLTFDPQADFTFVLEIVSDGTHLIRFSDSVQPISSTLPINRGATKIYFTKKLGVPYFEAIVSRLDAPDPVLLTLNYGDDINSNLLVTHNGADWNAHDMLKTTTNDMNFLGREFSFEFTQLVTVDHVWYSQRYADRAIGECSLRASNDGTNWVTLLYKNGEIINGNIPTEIKGCFRYFKLKMDWLTDNYPRGFQLWGTAIDNNESELFLLTPKMLTNTTGFATLTYSKIHENGALQLTDSDAGTYVYVKYSDDTTDIYRWIKYEFPEAQVANFLDVASFTDNLERSMRWYKLEGSNDDETWDLLLERQYQRDFTGRETRWHRFENSIPYKYYKLTCINTNGDEYWRISRFRLFRQERGKWNFYSCTPKLISAIQDGYEVSASSNNVGGEGVLKAFDKDSSTRWTTTNGGAIGSWVRIKLPEAAVFNAVLLTSRGEGYANQSPQNFKIQGSSDGEEWIDLSTQTGVNWEEKEQKKFTFQNETAYLYYRVFIQTVQSGSYAALSEIDFGRDAHEYKRLLHQYNSLIPILASNNDQGYIVTASSTFGGTTHPPYYVFDGDSSAGHKWLTVNGQATNSWLKVELPTAVTANVFSLQSPNEGYRERAPRSFKIQGSNDETTWIDFVVEANLSWSGGQLRQWNIENATSYKYYRVLILETNGGSLADIGNWNIYRKITITEY